MEEGLEFNVEFFILYLTGRKTNEIIFRIRRTKALSPRNEKLHIPQIH
jgi:hypothetical protein